MELVGKVTVVTGAAGGIGKALAEKFHQEGARVVLADLDEAALQLVAGPLNAKRPDSALVFAANLGTEAANAALVNTAVGTFGTAVLFFASAVKTLGCISLDTLFGVGLALRCIVLVLHLYCEL